MATKKQKEFAQEYLRKFPQTKELYLTPSGEFFTDLSDAKNALGQKKGKVETLKRESSKPDGESENKEDSEAKEQSDSEIKLGESETEKTE